MEPLLDCNDVAAQLKVVTPAWLRDQARHGRIDHRKIGSKYAFTQADVDALVERSRVAGHDPFALTARQLAAMKRRKAS